MRYLKCPECGGEDLIEGTLDTGYAVSFVRKGTKFKLFPERQDVECMACASCGCIFGLHTVEKKKRSQHPSSEK